MDKYDALIKEVENALTALGYDLNKHTFRLIVLTLNFSGRIRKQYVIHLDDKYFGVWDTIKKTFIDEKYFHFNKKTTFELKNAPFCVIFIVELLDGKFSFITLHPKKT